MGDTKLHFDIFSVADWARSLSVRLLFSHLHQNQSDLPDFQRVHERKPGPNVFKTPFVTDATEATFTSLHFLGNLLMGPFELDYTLQCDCVF